MFSTSWKIRRILRPVKKNAATPEAPPADAAGFERFQAELARLVAQFEKNFKHYQSAAYDEASVRQEFLDPLFRALGWDVENKRGLIPQHREVEIESRTEIAGRQKRADYLFRTDRQDRFVCEAKKPAEKLHAGYAFQAKRYAWNKGLVLAVLSDFEEMKLYLVGAKPHPDETEAGEWTTWHFLEYAKHARAMWDLLSRDAVAGGSIDRLVAALPRKPVRKTKAKQQWLFKPDRARAIDADFLDFLDEARRGLASDLIRHNDRADLLEGTRLDEAVQRILDRLLFLRICEDRDIDTGRPLANILKVWRDRKETPLWREIVAHFRALDRRPASHIPYFNGNLFKEHFSEDLDVGDEWISGFLEETGDEESAYLFNVIPVEILGTIYERFLGKTVRPHGRGVVIEEKPEVRKAGGVYYTPRYIVDYIVEQTLGKLLEGKSPQDSLKLRVLDPACGSGSFLIRAYERLCEHWQIALTKNESLRRKADCWTDPDSGDVHLTSDLKRRILTASIYGVDLDPGAVEVTQLSLYLKMLEGESRTTLAKNRELFGTDAPLLPPLQNNVKCGNSLIASDFSVNPDDLTRVRAFDWPEGFRDIMQAGGFDVVIGNPPYIRMEGFAPIKAYLKTHYQAHEERADVYTYFLERTLWLINPSGFIGMIVSNKFIVAKYGQPLRNTIFKRGQVISITDFAGVRVFKGATVRTVVLVLCRRENKLPSKTYYVPPPSSDEFKAIEYGNISVGAYAVKSKQIIDASQLTAEPWQLIPEGRAGLLRRLTNDFPKLKDAFGWHPLFGIKTGLNEAFVIDQQVRDQLLSEDKKNEEVVLPFLFGKDVKRYSIQSAARYVIYFHNGKHPKNYPAVRKHLEFYKTDLSQRAASQEWYELQQPAVTLLPLLARSKIVYPIISPEPRFALDNSGFLVNDKLFVLPTDSLFLLGLLNSSLGRFFFASICARLEGSGECYYEYRAQFVEKFPVCPIPASRAMHDKLVSLVDKMLLLVPKLRSAKSEGDRATLENAVAATDRAIDALVYELYGLTPEEIALVEAPHA